MEKEVGNGSLPPSMVTQELLGLPPEPVSQPARSQTANAADEFRDWVKSNV